MDDKKAAEIVIHAIEKVLGEGSPVRLEMSLIGDNALLDSMQLVELCLALEDQAEENDFEFDWASDATMSRSRSMFRSVEALSKEFAKQSEA